MTSEWYTVRYYYFPVGQGLFSSASVKTPNGAYFHWVYDCGTTSEPRLIDASLEHLASGNANIPCDISEIQLVTISHFDGDHVNGLVRLLGRFSVDILLLPYVPLWRRLILAVYAGVKPGDPLFGFYLDPAGYILAGERGRRIRRILFVSASDPREPPAPREEGGLPDDPEPPDEPDRPERGKRMEKPAPRPIVPDYDEAAAPQEAQGDPMLNGPEAARVGFLARNSSLGLQRFWEFVPYNDAAQSPSQADFDDEARELSTALLSAPNPDLADETLKELKKLYTKNFGSSAEAKNIISLFLFGGQQGNPLADDFHLAKFAFAGERHVIEWPGIGVSKCGTMTALGHMMTGDGYLNSCDRFRAFAGFFGQHKRLDKTAIFQVMHHGAQGNWHPGIADAVRPAVSVFSSDPHHRGFGHPHANVLRDFWTYQAVQADKDYGWKMSSRFAYV